LRTIRERHEVVIVGAGIAALSIGYRLARHGLRPLLVESQPQIASGSTTRNEGWLHAGTFHSQSISDPDQALRVARRCMYGHQQFREFCPEAVEDPATFTVAATLHKERIPEILARWETAGVAHEVILPGALTRAAPDIRIKNIEAAWVVKEVSINTRVLSHRLAAEIHMLGGRIVCAATIVRLGVDDVEIAAMGESIIAAPQSIVIAAGYGSGEVVRKFLGTTLNLRYWKSHLLYGPRIVGANVYGIDPHEANIAHHRHKTIVGMNEENIPCPALSLEVLQSEVQAMKDALGRLVNTTGIEGFSSIACMKVDVSRDPRKLRNLDVEIVEIQPSIFCAFPGKMTEAPFLADAVVREILATRSLAHVSRRPMDLEVHEYLAGSSS
jgi:hypothetical protein